MENQENNVVALNKPLHEGFDRQAFNVAFDAKMKELQKAEKITKKVLAELSREVLVQIHFDGDIQPINRLIDVLTPMNRKIAILFFQHFAGHHYMEKDGRFGKKDKNTYAKKLELATEFMADEANNIWTWAAEHVQIEAKPFELKKVTQFIERSLKKAEESGISQADVFRSIIAGGLEMETIMEVLNVMAEEDKKAA